MPQRDLRPYVALVRNRAVGRLGVPALLVILLLSCGPEDEPTPAPDDDVALASYVPPDDAPGFCAGLAASGELLRLPASVGTLVAGPDVEARTQVSRAVQELRDVAADVRDDAGPEPLAEALEELVGALRQVLDGELTDPVRQAVIAGLEQVGDSAQQVCGFPT